MVIVLEVLSRKNTAINHHKFSYGKVTIGRDFENDLRLDDPYVCPKHLSITYVPERNEYVLQDFSSINGSFVNKHKVTEQVLKANDVIKIGRTRLRVVDPQHRMPTTLPLSQLEEKTAWLNNSGLAILLTFAYVLFSLSNNFVASVADFKWSVALTETLGEMAVFSIWPLSFALLGKIFKQESHVVAQFNILWLTLLVLHALDLLENVLLFNFSQHELIIWLEFAVFTALIFIITWFSLFVAFHHAAKTRNIISCIMTLLVALPIAMLGIMHDDEFSARPSYSVTLLPPIYNLSDSNTSDEFSARSKKLFSEVERSIAQDKKVSPDDD